MRKRNFPRANFPHSPERLFGVLCFGDAEALAARLYVTVEQVERWRDGTDEVPFAVYEVLRSQDKPVLREQFGEFAGFYFDRGRLVSDHYKVAISLEDALNMREYRMLSGLVEKQAETIERLLVEKDFYRRQCHREAKFGMMINRLFK
jgi:hypothetical protein